MIAPALTTPLWTWLQHAFSLLADSSVVFALLAAGFLVFRTSREPHLLTWILGWCSYLLYRLSGGIGLRVTAGLRVMSGLAFVAAVALFVSALLLYTQQRRRFLALGIVAGVAAAIAVLRGLWLPQSTVLAWTFRLLCTLMSLLGAASLALFSRGRRQLGAGMVVGSIVLLHFDAPGAGLHALAGADMAIELLLAAGMLVLVLDDSQARTDRLAAVNRMAGAIAQAQERGIIILTALEELNKLMGARAAWFRLLQGDRLLLTHQVGLSEDYLRRQADLDGVTSRAVRVVQAGAPVVVGPDNCDAQTMAVHRAAGFVQVLALPVKGKSGVIGAIVLGLARARAYPPDEIHFLAAIANQIGIALENLELLQQILRSHNEWIRTFDAIEDSVLVHDGQFRVVRINRALLERLAGHFGPVALRACEEILPGGGERWHGCPYCTARANFSEGPDPCFGGFSIVTTSAFSDDGGQLTGTIHIIRDITGRRAAEEKYRLLFEQAQEGVFVSTPEGKLLDCNDSFVRMLGYDSRERVLELDVSGALYVQPGARQAFRDAIEQHGFVRNYEVELRRRDGSTITALENSFAERDAAGHIVRYQGFVLDISETKRAEDEIRRRNRELHALNAIAVVGAQSFDLQEIVHNALRQVVALFAADTGGIWLLDRDGVLCRHAAHGHRQVSPAPEFRVSPDLIASLREQHTEVITERDLRRLPAFVRQFAEAEGLVACAWALMWSKDQPIGVLGIGSRSPRQFSSTDLSLLVAIGRQVATTIEKVRLYQETRRAYDDLQRTQEQLLQSEKMSAIGQLVAGVAHELNNPLTAILGYAELLAGESLGERAHDFTGKLVKQTLRTQRLVQNLLSFARQRKPEKKLVDVRRVLEDTLALREYDMERRQIAIGARFEPNLPGIIADAHQIEQVFLNIINNAVDAMLDPADPGMETGRFDRKELERALSDPSHAAAAPRPAPTPGPHRLEVSMRRQNAHVCIEFHDSGPGIREPKKVFDPFYTTKSVGKGTGLGLSICYGIVKEHGGEITAANGPDGGALFRILLPAAQQPVEAPAVAAVSPAGPILRGRFLVVDDEESVREFARDALTQAGAEVVAVASGQQALARLECEQFDGVLLDVSLPGAWSGLDIYRWVADKRPGEEKNIVLMISDISQPEARRLVAAAETVSLAKPFQVPELLAAAQTLLQRRHRADAAQA